MQSASQPVLGFLSCPLPGERAYIWKHVAATSSTLATIDKYNLEHSKVMCLQFVMPGHSLTKCAIARPGYHAYSDSCSEIPRGHSIIALLNWQPI